MPEAKCAFVILGSKVHKKVSVGASMCSPAFYTTCLLQKKSSVLDVMPDVMRDVMPDVMRDVMPDVMPEPPDFMTRMVARSAESKSEQLTSFCGLSPESQGQNLALTVLCVP